MRYTLLFSLLCFAGGLNAQTTKPYFQQQVNYVINVTLDDSHNMLEGDIKMTYFNNSPDTLKQIYIHLWPNAYRDNNTLFARQFLLLNKTTFYFSKPEEKGYIGGMHFRVDDNEAALTVDSNKALDIALLTLPRPLPPNGTAVITTPFTVKIPALFSRMGYVGKHYEISQWYPKPAVYDNEGWHPISYLDQGEFYSEFGNFDVHISAHPRYKIACGGELKDSLNTERQSNPLVKWHYVSKNVHDIAWFADTGFVVKHTVFHTATHPVDIYIYSLPRILNLKTTDIKHVSPWYNADSAVKMALRYYGQWVGEYPYSTCKVVEGFVTAGGGMEYPTITVVSAQDDEETLYTAIVHEVGHNWFYGVLGFNERLYPWMDEGVNSYYEKRVMEQWYGNRYMPAQRRNYIFNHLGIYDFNRSYEKYLMYYHNFCNRSDQPANLPADMYTSSNYGAIVYGKVPLSLNYFAKFLTEDTFDARMQKFYRQFAYKHPQPADFKNAFSKGSGKYLDWFFDQLLTNTDQADYALGRSRRKGFNSRDTLHIGHSVFQRLRVHNCGEVKGPYSISAVRNDTVLHTLWYGGFRGKLDVLFPYMPNVKYRIDAAWDIPEINKRNNGYNALTHKKSYAPLRVAFGGKVDDPSRPALNIFPAFGYNTTDRVQIGVVLYNHLLCNRPVEFTIVPLFASGTGHLNFTGNITFNTCTKTKMRNRISYGLNAETFSYGQTILNAALGFTRVQPFFDYYIKPQAATRPISQKIRLDAIIINKNVDFDDRLGIVRPTTDYYCNLSFSRKNNKALNSNTSLVQLQYGSVNDNIFESSLHFVKLWGQYVQEINYNSANRFLEMRVFGGVFLYNSDRNLLTSQDIVAFHADGGAGISDYTFGHYFADRFFQSGFWSHQIMGNDGGLKVNAAQFPPYGLSNNYMLALNLTTPVALPFKAFADVVSYGKEPFSPYETLCYDAGILLDLNFAKVYFPFIFSPDLKTSIIRPNFHGLAKITFSIDLDKFRVLDQVKNVF